MKKTIYVAGPMTGLPEFNYPAFNEAAATLRAQGHTVLNPAENPVPACGTWQGYMRLALAQLVQCECIVLLPGWFDSRGALIERKLAAVLDMDVLVFNGCGRLDSMANLTEAAALVPVRVSAVDRFLS